MQCVAIQGYLAIVAVPQRNCLHSLYQATLPPAGQTSLIPVVGEAVVGHEGNQQMPDGKSAQMAFDNPAVPDMTLKDCEGSLQSATPPLIGHISQQPATTGAKMVSAKCVWSATDPVKPTE